jgi:Spy/CpxP family protein refolding chaperone
MARVLGWTCAALLFAGSPARAAVICEATQTQQRAGGPGAPQGEKDQPPAGREGRKKWWEDPELRAELGITDQQSKLVEQVWQKSLPKLREARAQLEKLEDALSQMLARDDADEGAVLAQIERVEAARADGNTKRTLMIYRMNKVLKPDQRAKVKAMMERREGGRRGPASR